MAVARTLLGYFQGPLPTWTVADQARLRDLVPEAARRAYDVKPIVETLADAGSVTYLRERFAAEMMTAFARIEGRPVGVLANNTTHVAGTITSDAADKAARFLQLCDAFEIPILSLVTRRASWWGPRTRRPAWSATHPGCWWPGRRCACRSWR